MSEKDAEFLFKWARKQGRIWVAGHKGDLGDGRIGPDRQGSDHGWFKLWE